MERSEQSRGGRVGRWTEGGRRGGKFLCILCIFLTPFADNTVTALCKIELTVFHRNIPSLFNILVGKKEKKAQGQKCKYLMHTNIIIQSLGTNFQVHQF